MIKTTVRAEICGAVYEYEVELPGTAAWADTPEETAVGLLYDHAEPGACADPSKPLTNLNPGPPEPPEYDGPTMPGDIRYPDPEYDESACVCTGHSISHEEDCGQA